MPAAPKLKIGFIGTGFIATYHSKSIRRVEQSLPFEIERTGVFDVDSARAASFAAASGHLVMSSPQEVIDSSDVVYICTWTSEHLEMVRKIAQSGKALFCEKPLATNIADAQEIVRLCEEFTITNQVGLVLRHSPAYLLARDLVHAPEAGRVMSVIFRDDQFIPIQGQYDSTWRGDASRAGAGTLLEHSIHDIDMLHAVIGPIAEVSARQSFFHGIAGIEDVLTASFSFAATDGSTRGLGAVALGSLTSIWHDNLARPSLRRVEIFCEKRFITIEGDDWFGPVSWTNSDGSSGTLAGDELVTATRALIPDHPNPDAAFLLAVYNRKPAYPDVSVALSAHQTVEAIYRSAREGGNNIHVGNNS
jgi:predicted dehydrogenase